MGYFILSEFLYISSMGAHWLTRLPATCNVTMITGKSLEKLLKQTKGDLVDERVYAGHKDQLPCRMIAIRAAPEIKKERQAQRREQAKKAGKKPCPDGLIRDGWHIMLTSLNQEEASAQELAVLYRSRWSIELQFRGLKRV